MPNTPEVSDIQKYRDALAGFEVTTPDKPAFITLDVMRRFYMNTTLRKLLGISAYDRVAIAYDPENRRLAVIEFKHADKLEVPTYILDKRHYMSARRFCEDYKYDPENGPYTFSYDKAASAPGIYYFRLASVGNAPKATKAVADPLMQTSIDEFLDASADEDAAPIPYITLVEGDRLEVPGVHDTHIYVRWSTKPRQLEIGYEEFPGSSPVNVRGNSVTSDTAQLAGVYAQQRPITFEFAEFGADNRLVFRKVKDVL
ncbi:hypothetical protein [Sporosarcina phage Lietuvens]|nr:hypothetical protein [Sporosarcina phage Lietuvens]